MIPDTQRARLIRVNNNIAQCLAIVRGAIDGDYRLDDMTLRDLAGQLSKASNECRADIGQTLETRPAFTEATPRDSQ